MRPAHRLHEGAYEALYPYPIGMGEAREPVAVDVEDAGGCAVDDERNDDFRPGRGVADDVIFECGHVVDDQRDALDRGRAADSSTSRQAGTRRTSAKGPQNQLAGRPSEIKARPGDSLDLVIDEGRKVGGIGDKIGLAGEQFAHLALEQLVGNGHTAHFAELWASPLRFGR